MPPFAQVYERFALVMHDRVTPETAENVKRIVEEMTPDALLERSLLLDS